MRIWVMRHGESETNKAGLWTGWQDAPLTENGRRQALALRTLLSDQRFDKVFTSDLSRAKETAEIALPGCEYEETALLREVNVGNIAGKPFHIVLDKDGKPTHLDGYAHFGGETAIEFRDRIDAFMKRLQVEKCESIAVFAHAGVMRVFLELTLGVRPMRGRVLCKNCAAAVFEYSKDSWHLYSWSNLE